MAVISDAGDQREHTSGTQASHYTPTLWQPFARVLHLTAAI